MTQGPKNANPQQIEAEINQTRSAISSDIQELGQKLEPERLKSQAKGAITEAADHLKGEAREAINEAKEAVVQKYQDAKQEAFDTVSDTFQSVGGEVRHAAHETWGFARRNAVPLAFIGIGAAWLMANRRAPRTGDPYDPRGEWQRPSRLSNGVERAEDTLRNGVSRGAGHVRGSAQRFGERAHDLGERAEHALHDGSARARHALKDGSARARHALQDGSARARHFAEDEWQRVRTTSTDFARDNPLALGAIALAAGVGVGLLLPPTAKENQLLGETRDRLVGEARDTVQGLGDAAKDVATTAKDTAKEAAQDVKRGLTQRNAGV